jgi:hypothetical protein
LPNFARTNLLNFVRAGDGLTYRDRVYGARSELLGRNEEIGGIEMDQIVPLEVELNEKLSWYDLLGRARHASDNADLSILYYKNHSILSFHRTDFVQPLQRVLPAYGQRRPRRFPPLKTGMQ